ncbi:M3 family oligoendopeptidase [Bacillus testis]|uniref:M3 family oligoendopeptidase n=1 Tax=Bacillus testis TaxID=1622072 RepID=UPI00067F69A9|nr:M3 family oligoendopeptidase [Bacillus testis]
MAFNHFVYERPQFGHYKTAFEELLKQFKDAPSIDVQETAMKALNDLRNTFDTMKNLVYVRHTIDTNDDFYKEEQAYLDEVSPEFEELDAAFYQALIASPYRKELEEKWGKTLFLLAETKIKTLSPEIIQDLQVENKLISEYTQLIASAKIPWNGEELTIAQLAPYKQSTDRAVRKNAVEAIFSFMSDHRSELDSIYDQLVKIRTRMAVKLGFESFVELGYYRMNRLDYNADMVAVFRKQVQEYIVPLATELRKRQEKRIGVDSLKFYDESLDFQSGNAEPKGDAHWIIQQGMDMYKELSHETGEFYTYMMDNGLMDLVAKKGKAGGGYCTYFFDYKAPFIFSNFNGTSDDIDVLTHEAGHAFQVYESRHFKLPEYIWPTMEACEIHSMSMEFFTWPWMGKFFGENEEKYKFAHLSSALLFLPYGVAVDEFQHYVYSNPKATPEERNQAWKIIEKKYLPHRDYEGNEYLESGAIWQLQSHIYTTPFYYIDYTLAQICAFQFWKRSRDKYSEAWTDYLKLCREGGSKTFLELVEVAHLTSPFEENGVKSVVDEITKYLRSVDDQSL